ncbi:MAG: Rrf2 family transcriptional regulator [Pseudomonadota bacterium]
MRLSKQTSDAVKILTACARADDGPVKAATLSEEVGVTKQLGLKLVNGLARLGYVETIRGPRGGLRLARPAHEISLGQVVRDFEALRAKQTDTTGDEEALSPMLDTAFEAFVSVLDAHTIADLAAAGPGAGPGVSPGSRPAKSKTKTRRTPGRRPRRSETRSAAPR